MEVIIIRSSSQKVSTWSGGETNEIYIYPEESSYIKRNFLFRVSSATINVEESKFTKLEGIQRFITTLNNDIVLIHNGKEKIRLRPYHIHEFSGSINTESIGEAKDFNLMVKDGTRAEVKCIDVGKDITEEKIECGQSLIYAPISEIYVYINHEEYFLNKGDAMVIKNYENIITVNLKSKHSYKNKAICCKVGCEDYK